MSDTAGTTESVRYEPAQIEQKWMQRWLDAGVFDADVDPDRKPYTIVIPPPNVTGALHMGHALNGSIQDALIRFHRMRGYNACWIPGTDHAGIATQAVVEKTLRAEGVTRQELGREKFLERVWEWKNQYGATIIDQFKRLGCSCDYRRERFTMDEGYARAVLVAFVKLYEKGLIYRDNYIINWDAGTMSAISDLEVVQKEVEDEMVQVDYHLVDGSGHITVATVRPETIVADVAVAVHPDDERYRDMVGKLVKVPLTDREVPVIADEYVDREFGTGVLKITPGHDPNDFEIGRRHKLLELSAIDFERKMTDLAGSFAGMGADEARVKMTDELERLGVLRSREPYRHNVPHSDRSGVRIEPLISLQWFADMRELAKPAIAAVKETGEMRFIPEGATNIYLSWMENLKPWCLSRQLWWGHQLPVWYRGDEIHVSLDGPDNAEAEGWTRDEDVLDTWFSSGMWDFATLGWPEQTADLEYFHPTAVLCTARDIINLWVARMMMFSYEFLGEKSFSDVYIHSVIQAPDGRRMSKSLGTGVDPLDLIDQYGADATRYGLLNVSSTQDVRFNEGKIREGRDLANKLWNASRLLVMLGDAEALQVETDPGSWTRLEDRWIAARLHRVQGELTKLLEEYDFANYTKTMYHFVWNELCDWYLESVKGRLRSEDQAERTSATQNLSFVLDRTLRLVHPVMPHITEEIACAVWGTPDDASCCVATSTWHESTLADADAFHAAEAAYESVKAAVSWLRSLREAAEVKPSQPLAGEFLGDATQDDVRDLLGVLANVEWGSSGDAGVAIPGTVPLRLHGLDGARIKERLSKQLKTAQAEVKRSEGKLGNEKFTSRAPAELVAEEQAKLDAYRLQESQLQEVLAQL